MLTRAELKAQFRAREIEKRRAERLKTFDPPDDTGYRALALSVIFDVAKLYMPGYDNIDTRECRNFFLGPDYRFWQGVAKLNLSGEEILRHLEECGGLPFNTHRHVKPSSKKVQGKKKGLD